MAEYIEREAAISVACKGCNKEFPNEPCEPADCHIQQGLFAIPAADVVEVVRCKNCAYRGKDDCPFHIDGEPADEELLKRLDNDFCSYGAKMDGKGE